MKRFQYYSCSFWLTLSILIGLTIKISDSVAQSAIGQLESMTGQRIDRGNTSGSSSNYNSAESLEARREAREAARDARESANRVRGLDLNKKGIEEYQKSNWKEAASYFKKALRAIPTDNVIRQNLKNAEDKIKYAESMQESDKEAAKAREKFNKVKQPVLKDFSQPASLSDISIAQVEPSKDILAIKGKSSLGIGTLPVGQVARLGGLTEAEWDNARECQKILDQLSKKWPLSAEEITLYDTSLAKRNALWVKAITVPGMTGSERERLRIKLYTKDLYAGDQQWAIVSKEKFKALTKSPPPPLNTDPPEKLRPAQVSPIDLKVYGTYSGDKGDALVEIVATEYAEKSFEGEGIGHLVGVGRIIIAYKQGSIASAISATADYLVGTIPIPQASWAVEAGRMYANTAYQLQNKFMRNALSVTGKTFDEKKFWDDLDNDCGTGFKAVREWVGYGAK